MCGKEYIPLFGLSWFAIKLDEASMLFWLLSEVSIIPDVPRYGSSEGGHAAIAANSSIQRASVSFFLHSSLNSRHASLNVTKEYHKLTYHYEDPQPDKLAVGGKIQHVDKSRNLFMNDF